MAGEFLYSVLCFLPGLIVFGGLVLLFWLLTVIFPERPRKQPPGFEPIYPPDPPEENNDRK